mmetsp:Transcript_317/g.617  ORF Transcript_317/g.617 Transcript_317/m.617 type:complete len:150 (-) Transcript_317:88-537(-)
MWHLNIPVFRHLDRVAEHERDAVLSLAGGWQSFGSNLPQTQSHVRENGLAPVVPSSAISPAAKPRTEGPLKEPPEEASWTLGRSPQPATAMRSVDVSWEVMRASAFAGAGRHGLPRSQKAAVEVEDGRVRLARPSAMSVSRIFRLIPKR